MKISFVTWNLESFQHPTESEDSKRKKMYNKKLDYVENVLVNKLKLPDVIGFQEILGHTKKEDFEIGTGPQRDTPKCLQDLEDRLKKHASYTLRFSNYRNRGLRLAIFSKYPISLLGNNEDIETYDMLGTESHTSFPWVEEDSHDSHKLRVFEYGDSQSWYEKRGKFTRPVMRVRISANDKHFQVFMAHLKSKRPRYDFELEYPNTMGDKRKRNDYSLNIMEEARGKMRSLFIRTREACQLRQIINNNLEKYKDDSVVLLGSFGDTLESLSTQILAGTVKNNTDVKDKELMLNVNSLIKKEKRFTCIYDNLKEDCDHIIASKELKINKDEPEQNNVMIYNEDVLKKSLVPDGFEYVPNHAPVMVNFEI